MSTIKNGTTTLMTNQGNLMAELKCLNISGSDDALEIIQQSGINMDQFDNIVFKLPNDGLTCIATFFRSDLERVKIKGSDLTSKDAHDKEREIKRLQERHTAATFKLKDFPDAEIILVDLEPEARKISKVDIQENDPEVVKMIKKVLDKADLEEGDTFAKKDGVNNIRDLDKRLQKLTKNVNRLFYRAGVQDVDGKINISIISAPIPKMIEVNPDQAIDPAENAIKEILYTVLIDEGKMIDFCAGDQEVIKRINELVAKERHVLGSIYNYSITSWDINLDDKKVMNVHIQKTQAPVFAKGTMANLTDEEQESILHLYDAPYNDYAFQAEAEKLQERFKEKGYVLVLTTRMTESNDVRYLDAAKVPIKPRKISVAGDFPPSKTEAIIQAFGYAPDEGFTMAELIGDATDKEKHGIEKVRKYLESQGYVVDHIGLDSQDGELIIRLALAKLTVGRLVVSGPADMQPTDKKKKEAAKEMKAAIENLVKEYGDNGRYICNETLDYIAAHISRITNTANIETLITKDEGKSVVNLVAMSSDPKHNNFSFNGGYGAMGGSFSVGYAYNTGKGLIAGGDIDLQADTDSLNYFSARLFIDKVLGKDDEIYVSIYSFYTDYGEPKSTPKDQNDPASELVSNGLSGTEVKIGTEVKWEHAIGDHFSIGLGTALEFFVKSPEGKIANMKPNLSFRYSDGRNSTTLSANASLGSTNYVTLSAFYEHRLPLGDVFLSDKLRDRAIEKHINNSIEGKRTYAPVLKFRIGGSKQFGSAPLYEQINPYAGGAIFPTTLMSPDFKHGSYMAGGNIVFEQPIDENFTFLLGTQAYIIDESLMWGAAAGISFRGISLWLGYCERGFLIYLSPAQMVEKAMSFETLKERSDEFQERKNAIRK